MAEGLSSVLPTYSPHMHTTPAEKPGANLEVECSWGDINSLSRLWTTSGFWAAGLFKGA